MNITTYIEQTLTPQPMDSTRFFYDEMESQSGEWLPVIYQPFDAANAGHWADRGFLYDFLLATHGTGKRLLDFGPGDGWPALLLAPFAQEVVGVDGSEKRVQVCQANAARLGIHNARFVRVAPGAALPFPDESFDGATAASSIEQSPEPAAIVGELYRVLKPGGRLRIFYEGLNQYRGREREMNLDAAGDSACWITLYDRDIAGETARMFRLRLSLPAEEVARRLPPDAVAAGWDAPVPAWLETLQRYTLEARACTLRHPAGATLLRWLREAGFQSARTTHSAGPFAARLFQALPERQRPQTLEGVDALLRPAAQVIVDLEAPAQSERGWDPMITAIK